MFEVHETKAVQFSKIQRSRDFYLNITRLLPKYHVIFQCLENQEMEAKLESGLIVGHAYGVSRVYEVS